jgi:thioredoxin-like negative regulator of GroEL
MSGDGKGGRAVRRPRAIGRPQLRPGPLADLKALLYELYLEAGAPTLDEIAAAVAADDKLAGAPGRDTIGRIIGDPGLPASQADVVAVVTVLAQAARWDPGDAAGRAQDLWVAARMASARYPAEGVRVGEADPRRLGVHAAISVPGVPDEIPPEYVPRDADDGEFGVRAKVAAAAQRGGFVLLVGGSSVGKTRCALEAVTTLLPDWWLVHPAGPGGVAALAAAPTPRTVVWLDELQRYLDGEHGLTGAVVRALLNASAVIIGTMWPDRYAVYTTVPAPAETDPYDREREVLDLAAVIRIAPEFSEAEQDRARAAAGRDPRLAIALSTAEYGLTQTLAAAPQLVARWQDAQTTDPYAWAVLTAALDVAWLGARAPLSAEFLRAAAPGYCTSQQQAEAPENWFEQALAYATGKLHGAAAALSPAAAGMGQVAGYTAADYLVQHATWERRYERVPASTWDAVLSHLRDPADAARLGDSADRRLLYRYAIPLYRRATDAGDEDAAWRLVSLLAERGDLEGAAQVLRARADAGDDGAAFKLAELLAYRGDVDGLRARADAGEMDAAGELARLLAERGDVDGLRARADSGDVFAAFWLSGLLAKRGDLDGAEQILDGAAQILCARADSGDALAARALAGLLAERGDVDGLRSRADAGEMDAAEQLARLLAERGDVDGLRSRADSGDALATWQLIGLLAKRGDVDGLRARADAGDGTAARRLAGLLAKRGDLDGAEQILRARVDTGDADASWQLSGLLAKRGDLDGAEQIMRARADTGDGAAAVRLADLLAQRGDLDGLRAWADVGDRHAAEQLARLLVQRGDLDGLWARAEVGDWVAVGRLADLLANRGDLDEAEHILRAWADAGGGGVASRLPALLIKQGRGEEAERLRQFGLNPDGSIACA